MTNKDNETKGPPAIPSQVHQRTWLELENTTDYAAFQQLCDEVLTAHWGYKIHPRGMSPRGTVKGRPDSWGHDEQGKLCAFEYGTSPNWRSKLEGDLKQVASISDFSPEIFVFCTNRSISDDAERECAAMVRQTYGWELRLYGLGDLAIPLDTKWQDIRKRILHIDIEHHNWISLLAVCEDHRRRVLMTYRYSGKYDPSLYVHRTVEYKIGAWYRHAMTCIRQEQAGKPEEKTTRSHLLVVIDQAGVGKTNVALHLAEKYGKDAPVLILPGNIPITDIHTLEREVVDAVSYPVDDRTYHAKVHEVCQIAQHEGYPFLVIIEGINENRDPRRMGEAIEQMLSAYQKYPLLLLVTCRDTFWPLIQSPILDRFLPEGGAVSLGLYTDEEFERACKTYFSHWKVNINLSVEAGEQLRSPLLLSIFAEVNHQCPFTFVPFVVAKDLWERYLAAKVDAIHDALEREKSKQAIRTAIEHIALRMLEWNSPTFPYSDISDINPHIDPDDTRPQSLFLQLKNAGVLKEDPPETISFVYDAFFEYVAGRTLAHTFEKPPERERVLRRVEELAQAYRWRQVPLYIAELVSEPDAIIEHLCSSNLWLAAQALTRVPTIVSVKIRQQVLCNLEEKLSSRFSLDRQRAAHLLGSLKTNESKEQLLRVRTTSPSNTPAALCALARIGAEEIEEPFIRYLGRFLEWYIPDDQELVNTLPTSFRQQLLEQAVPLLQDTDRMQAAAHTLGYLKAEQAVTPLLAHLEATEWSDWVALMALLRIGTQEAFKALERALGEIGEKLSLLDKEGSDITGRVQGNQNSTRSTRDELYGALTHLRIRGFQHCQLDEIVPFLTRLLEHPNEYVRSEAIQSLGNLGAFETALALVQSAHHSQWAASSDIQEALSAFGEQIAVEPILALVQALSTPDAVKGVAIRALGFSRDKRVLQPFSVCISQRRFLFEVIQALGDTRLAEAIPLLVQILEDTAIDFAGHSSLNREHLEDMVIVSLGELQHPDAFEPIAGFTRKNLPAIGFGAISALAATGGNRAIPLLREVWERVPETYKHRTVLNALLWIGTRSATEEIFDLLRPLNKEKTEILIHALAHGRGLDFINGTISGIGVLASLDDRFIDFIDTSFDELSPETKLRALFALEYIATLPARRLLERIAADSKYDIARPGAQTGPEQTIRNVAIGILRDLGSPSVIDMVLDTLSNQLPHVIEFYLKNMDHKVVRDALQYRLKDAHDMLLIRLLTLLGTFGDDTLLPTLQPYIIDHRRDVADAAYTAEQRILGLAYL